MVTFEIEIKCDAASCKAETLGRCQIGTGIIITPVETPPRPWHILTTGQSFCPDHPPFIENPAIKGAAGA